MVSTVALVSTKPNHRRDHGRLQDHGPAWESPTPCAGCNSTHVARARRWWKRSKSRAERRTEAQWDQFVGSRYRLPPDRVADLLSEASDELAPDD